MPHFLTLVNLYMAISSQKRDETRNSQRSVLELNRARASVEKQEQGRAKQGRAKENSRHARRATGRRAGRAEGVKKTGRVLVNGTKRLLDGGGSVESGLRRTNPRWAWPPHFALPKARPSQAGEKRSVRALGPAHISSVSSPNALEADVRSPVCVDC